MPDISVIICTSNRNTYLEKALKSLIRQDYSHERFEIIVVENASTGSTRQIIESITAGSPVAIHYLLEKRQGLSHARNTGVRKARGRIIAFMDDDACADENWLNAISESFRTVKPEPGCVGGKVLPVWLTSRPDWMPDSLLQYLSIRDLGDSPHWVGEEDFIAGTNMAFTRQTLLSAELFETSLGRKGNSLISGEEILLFARLRSSGKEIYYQPRAVVKHMIPEERTARIWLFRRIFSQGISDYRSTLLKTPTHGKNGGISFLTVIKKGIKALIDIITGGSNKRYSAMAYLLTIAGYAHGFLCERITGPDQYKTGTGERSG